MKPKLTISVRSGGHSYAPGPEVARIHRVVWGEAIGNFNPIFCRYKRQRTLVHSEEGDLSDPFRRTEEYKRSLFIIV